MSNWGIMIFLVEFRTSGASKMRSVKIIVIKVPNRLTFDTYTLTLQMETHNVSILKHYNYFQNQFAHRGVFE